MTKVSFAYSPCPNDTFMFEAIVNNRIDTLGLDFDIELHDVALLNQRAALCQYDITKLSYNAYTRVSQEYQLLTTGSALGYNCGPLLIAKQKPNDETLHELEVAIPGLHTTANLLLSIAYPNINKRREVLFSEVEDMVVADDTPLGLIIHENRFTYQDKGLIKIKDLGEYWESVTKCPIPLGGIAVRRSLSEEVKLKIHQVLKSSIKYAMQHPTVGQTYVIQHAQEMDPEVMKAHIELYVNENSIELSPEAYQGIECLFAEIKKIYPKRSLIEPVFVKK